MSVNLKAAFIRLGRVMLYGAVSAGVAHLVGHVGDFVPYGMFVPAATAILMAVDKYVRNELHDALVGQDEGESV